MLHRIPRLSFIFLTAVLFALTALLVGSAIATNVEVGPRAAFNGLQLLALGKLTANWDTTTGIPRYISSDDAQARIPYTPSAKERGDPVAIARGFLNQNRAMFKLTSATDELKLLRNELDLQLHYSHVRLDQVYQGIPVYGRQLVVHLDPQNQIVAVTGQFAPDINIATQPHITQAEAEQVALDDLLNNQLQADERARVKTTVLNDKTSLVVYVDGANHPTLTWYVTIMTGSPLGQWYYFINANRLAVTHTFDSAEHIKQRKTYSANNGTDIPGRALINEGERSSRDAIAQAAHDGAGVVYDYYFNTFKRDGVDGQGSPMVSTVHYGNDPSDAENAAWIGEYQQMIYGDGGKIFKPLAYGLDVVGHEFTHGVVGSTADLEYQGQSGALNESFADIFGTLIDRGNWTVGEQVIKSPPYPVPELRSLEDPGLRGNYDPRNPLAGVGQPSTVREYARLALSRRSDNGGVHINSGIPNHAAFLIGSKIGKDKLEQIYYRTLTQYLSPSSDFQDDAAATVRSAQDLYGAAEVQAVRDGFGAVGINVSGADSVPTSPTNNPNTTGSGVPPPVVNLPQGCVNLVSNGTFETDEAWREASGQRAQLLDPQLPHTGKRSAWLGGQDKEPIQLLYQDIKIPDNSNSAQLNFYRYTHQERSGFSGLFAGDATFSTLIADPNGQVLATVEKIPSSQANENWSAGQFDLSRFAGKNIRLAFSSENPRGNVSSVFVDDVALIACTSGAPPAAPQASASSVFIQGNVLNADTNRGIPGASVYIMKPGISASQAAADDQVTRSEVIAVALTDGNGFYQSDVAIPVGRAYSVIVIASGFRPVIADDGMNVPPGATNPFKQNATLRRSR